MNVGFVATNYNNSQFTVDMIESLFEVEEMHFCPIFVVDNDSSTSEQELLEKLERRFSFLRVIYNDRNLGYFPGLNIGIERLRYSFPYVDHLVIGNNDLIFGKDFLVSLRNNREIIERYPVISPDIVTKDGIHQNPHAIARIGWFRECMYDLYYCNYFMSRAISTATALFPLTRRRDDQRFDEGLEIHQGYGACYLLTPLFFEHFNSLWAPTFLMGEEYFLSLQLEKKGMTTYYEPSIKVTHCEHATTRTVPQRKMWEIARKSHKVYRQHKKRV